MSLRNHNWREVLKVLTGFGYVLDRQRGSHMILKNSSGGMICVTTVSETAFHVNSYFDVKLN
ncbi:MAG: hypothetical protein COV65_07100 [Nitrosopumilales archaeon CG11_big_fil_rev_8_21_14_0_20_33_24]|nr:MAG: hypothetical protein COV65_07100 [Nitrosopumilales archaeon CG11_big_fil_rev_8_21_14_0_20_33_24]PIY89884.1 MAG: hypothetical protein COY74_04455 [Nitrosopumilales archaeon CG_4_10_14_0_8_um_filter_34_8]PJB98929.1 MAG: hypothetical protein CO079_01155 [Nitrosopumilales archaeon CG_4_9_14_0_8_um_filter_34_10]